MKTGFRGTFVISWSQTDIDGLDSAPIDALQAGAAWAWHGEAVRVDGPNDLLRLDMADGEADIRKRAARKVRRLVGAVVQNTKNIDLVEVQDPLMDSSFVVTNGAQSFTVTLIEVGTDRPPLLMFLDEMPPRNTDLWVVHQSLGTKRKRSTPEEGGVICFTPGTRILTPNGPVPVQDLRPGDTVQTRDSGPQDVLWTGQRRMTGARLFVMPHLRPVRIRTGALGIDRPDQELLVSPEHRMLVRGPAAQALFNAPEVLVAARDLINGSTIAVDLVAREITYVHVLLPSHQILWANGVETESFHPANAAFDSLSATDRTRLLAQLPELEHDPHSYGDFARRNLSASEAAILRYEAA
ncbi:MAG: Hint domain-containing protein [Sedimentitalea sp.]